MDYHKLPYYWCWAHFPNRHALKGIKKVPELITSLLAPLYIITLLVSAVVIGYFIVSVRFRGFSRDSPEVPDIIGEIDDVSAAFIEALGHNPVYMWGTITHKANGKEHNIPFPVFRWWALFGEDNRNLRNQVSKAFLMRFSPTIENACIYCGTAFAYDLLHEIEPELDRLGTSITLDARTIKNSSKQNIIFFDIAISTGTTTHVALQRLPSDCEPKLLLYILFNDFVPPDAQARQSPQLDMTKVKVLYSMSEIIPHWMDKKEIAASLLTIRNAMYEDTASNWDSFEVKGALEILRNVLR